MRLPFRLQFAVATFIFDQPIRWHWTRLTQDYKVVQTLAPTSRVTRDTRLCKPGSVAYRTGLGHAETEIGKWPVETGAAKPPVQT